MNVLKRISVVLGVVIVGSYFAYEHLLSSEQRENMRAAQAELETVFTDTYDSIASVLPNVSTKAEEMAAVKKNQARTRQQWEKIGF